MQTIFAPITADVNAPIALIRVSGAEALLCLDYLGVKKNSPKPRFAYLSKFYAKGVFLDEGLFTYFKGPHSFTGDDVVEIAIHGGLLNLNKFLKLLAKIPNCRYAEAGEFSKRAFLNGKIDLVQAEGINDFIKAETELQLLQAQNLFRGKSSEIYNNWREKLINLLSLVEAYIDFPDEDLPESLLLESRQIVDNLKEEAQDFVASNQYGEQIRSGFYIAIIGKPNVGKSTLLNKLSGRDVAITSNIAGTTRDVIEVHLDIAGMPVILADTAGIRETQDEIEKIGVDRAKKASEDADLKLQLFDSSDEEMPELFANNPANEKEIKLVAKSDIALALNQKFISEQNLESYSFMQEDDVKKIVAILEKKVKETYHLKTRSLLASKRHLEEVKLYLDYLNKFSLDEDVVLAAFNLRMAVNAIDKIIGKIDVEEILGKIFASFCIGK